MLTKILLGLGIVIIVFVVIVATQPSQFQVTRTARISAPPSVVFALVNDFHKWDAWSPWAKIDPAMKQTYEGAPSSAGAIYTWTGNSQVGAGRMTISESQPGELIRIDLQFQKPFPGSCPTEFSFKPEGKETVVTWTMSGRHTFIPKAVSLFVSMDKMIGGQFEKGLAEMKAIAEAAGSQPSTVSAKL
jgi:uncharacterized protein YndB with AHSA1/START domain